MQWVVSLMLWPLYPRKKTPISIKYEAGCASELVWAWWIREKPLSPDNHSDHSSLTTLTKLAQLHGTVNVGKF
jgi:hypothetical protein